MVRIPGPVLVDHPKVGLLWVLSRWSQMAAAVQECAAPAALAGEVEAWWGKRAFPLEAVVMVKKVFPGAEVVGHRLLREKAKVNVGLTTWARDSSEDE